MTVLITLTTAGADTGPFNLYSDVDGYSTAFETGVAKVDLEAGYVSYLVPDGTTIIKVLSTGTCKNSIFISVVLTTTTTTTLPDPPTSTLTFSSYEGGVFTFTLSDAIYSTSFMIEAADVEGSTTQNDCTAIDSYDSISLFFNPLSILPGQTTASVMGISPFTCDVLSYSKVNSITINGYGTYVDGDTLTIGGTLVTVSIPTTCVNPYVCAVSTEWNNIIVGDDIFTVCTQPPITIYTPFGQTIVTGTIIYLDALLTTPIVGSTFIVQPGTNGIFALDPLSGQVGAYTGSICV